jgi:hypothetical protein
MPNPFSAALAADPIFRLRLEGRFLNALGVAALALAGMVFAKLSLAPGPCVIAGIALASAFYCVGKLLARTTGGFAATTNESVAYAAYVVWLFAAYDAASGFGAHDALPYLLCESAVVVALALAFRDKVLHAFGVVASIASLALCGSLWQEWSISLVTPVVVACYTLSVVYGGTARGIVTKRQAWWLERAFGLAGYATLIYGTYSLGVTPWNTICLAVEALALIAFGFATDKVGHRFSGVVAIFLACGKLWILDLSGAGAGIRTGVGFAAFCVCSITAGIFYLVEYVWKSKPRA